MKNLLCFIVFVSFTSAYSQDENLDIIGKWKVIDIDSKYLSTYCFSSITLNEIKLNLKKDYCGVFIEFLDSKRILYRDNNGKLHQEKDCLHFLKIQEFKWVLDDKKNFILTHKDNERRIKVKYLDKKIYLNFARIVFELEKVNSN